MLTAEHSSRKTATGLLTYRVVLFVLTRAGGTESLIWATPICRYMMSATFAFAPLRLRRDLMDQPKQGAQQNAQQRPSVGLRSRFGYAAVSVISLYSSVINCLVTITYKGQLRTENPCVGGSNPLLTIQKPRFRHRERGSSLR